MNFRTTIFWRIIRATAIGVTLVVSCGSKAFADSIEGFGIWKWGEIRDQIVAAEGTPDAISSEGVVTYTSKSIFGKKAKIVFVFEPGCKKDAASVCKLSAGSYMFEDVTQEFFGEVEAELTRLYGLPTASTKGKSNRTDISRNNGSTLVLHFREDGVPFERDKIVGPFSNAIHGVAYRSPSQETLQAKKKQTKERGL